MSWYARVIRLATGISALGYSLDVIDQGGVGLVLGILMIPLALIQFIGVIVGHDIIK